MKKRSCRTVSRLAVAVAVGLSLVMAAVSAAIAEDQSGGLPGDWLSHYVTARSMGVGGAYVSTADEPLAALWNPAGFSQIFQNVVHFETTRLFEGTSVNGFSFARPGSRFPNFGFTILHLRSGDFERTNELNESMGTFSEGETAFLLSASKRIARRLTLGTNVKVIHQQIDVFSGSGVGADLGLLVELTPALRVGASVLNIGGPTLTLRSVGERYPVEFRGGVSAYLLGGRSVFTAEIDRRSSSKVSYHGGSEFWVHPSMALRVGYHRSAPSGGFSYRFASGIRIDYGMSNQELGATHRIGVSYQFGGFYASSEAYPPVFSPIGEQSVTRFDLKARAKSEIRNWRLDILDKSDQVVRSFSGQEAPPAHVMWDGKSESGLPLPDGIYRYTLVVIDDEGRRIEGRVRSVEITTAGPEGAIPIVVE